MWLKKIILKVKLYFQFFKYMKSQGENIVDKPVNRPVDEPIGDKFYLKFNVNSFKYLEWADYGTMKLPMYYFMKNGEKYYYLHWCEKTIGEQRMFIADKSLTTLN